MFYWVYLVCQNLSFCKVEIDTTRIFFSAAWQYLFVHSWMQHVLRFLSAEEAGFDRLADLRRENEYLKKDMSFVQWL